MTILPTQLSLVCLAGSLLVACGGSSSGASANTPVTSPTTPTTTATTTTTPTTPTPPVAGTLAIDPTHLPIGDGKVSTSAPQVGYVFACTLPNSSNPSGKAPWISADGLTWDATVKTAVRGSVSWLSQFSANLSNGILNLSGNGLPAHPTGTFPVSPGDPAYQYDRNPNTISSAAIAWGLPGDPVVAASPSCTSLGAIGVMLSGARLYNALDADGRDAAAHEVQDVCGGHPQGMGTYHYHNLSSCLAQSDTAGAHSPLIGYIADGFGIYGNLGEQGKALTNADLDECHGHAHLLTVGGVAAVRYHYHMSKEYPYTIGCYKGKPASID